MVVLVLCKIEKMGSKSLRLCFTLLGPEHLRISLKARHDLKIDPQPPSVPTDFDGSVTGLAIRYNSVSFLFSTNTFIYCNL